MNSVYVDSLLSDDERRKELYAGQLFIYSPTANSLALVDFAKSMLHEAFGPMDPEMAQFHMDVEEYAAVLADLKPRFIHHPKCKELLPGILRDLRFDLEKTFFDVPRMRTSTSDNYLTTGIAFAFHPHRDTWYSAPFCQLNYWMPIFPVSPENAMAFHPRYWSHGVRNGSQDYNYAEWNRSGRLNAARQIKSDTRKQPKPEEPIELDPQIRLLPPPGGIIIFSAAQMHSSVPNTSGRTRLSIDFRTVHLDDAVARRGAPNVDSQCPGTTMGDYLRGADFSHLPKEVINMYDTPAHQVLR
jgi:hypothetical protein